MRSASDSLAGTLDLAFWPVLTLAAALFALATLAPGLAEWGEVRDRLAAADTEAEALRAEIDGLARVSAALRADPAFAAEVARLDLGLARDGADRLAVPAAPPPVAFVPPAATASAPSAFERVVVGVAADRRLRVTLAAVAAGLAAVAFTLCQPAAAPLARRLGWVPGLLSRAAAGRYRAGP